MLGFDRTQAQAAQIVFASFGGAGHAVYIVGGAVRNHLIGEAIGDIDFAVSCAPDESITICEANEIHYIKTGFDHGTITLIVNGISFEVTSFRKDVETDGRHAITHFGGTLAEDAARRDFTINALYADETGAIIDPIGGHADINARKLRFIGDATTRIHEDYLRILRYYRFLSQYKLAGDDPANTAIEAEMSGLERVARERIGMEMRKIFDGRNLQAILPLISNAFWAQTVPEGFDQGALESWLEFERKHAISPNWIKRTAASMPAPSDEWKLSKREGQTISTIQNAANDRRTAAILGYEYGDEIAIAAIEMKCAKDNVELDIDAIENAKYGARQHFPLQGKDLLADFAQGPKLGKALAFAKQAWLDSGFALETPELIAIVHDEFMKDEHHGRG